MDIKTALERKRMWLTVDDFFDDSWDYIEKRVLSETLGQKYTPPLMMAAVLKNLLLYRKPVCVVKDGDSTGIIHAFLSLDTRQDHLAQEDLIIRETQASIILTNKGQKEHPSFRCTKKERLRAFGRAVRLSRSAVSQNVITWREFPKILNVLVKTLIDRSVAEKIAAFLREKQGTVVLSCLQMESLRGMIKPLKVADVRIATYQHGILGHNGGFSEEHQSDIRILWKEHDKQVEIENSVIVPPTKMLVSSTYPKVLNEQTNPERSISHVVYVSSPSLARDTDPDMDLMNTIAQDIRRRGLVEKLIFCLHPSKTASDYAFLKNLNVVSGMGNLPDPTGTDWFAFIGLNSTALYNKAIENHFVAQVKAYEDDCGVIDDPAALPVVHVSDIFDYNNVPNTAKIKPVANRKMLFASHFGTFVPGALKGKLSDEFQ